MLVPKRLYGIIGDPVLHSPSPAVHNTAFQVLGIPAVFLAWQISPDMLPAAIQAVRTLKISGVAVTLPHKEKIIPLLDLLSPEAQHMGAVNTLYWEDNKLVGHNYDAMGFMQPLQSRPPTPTALILGAGGAARAVLGGLLSLPCIERIIVSARRPEQAQALISSTWPAEIDERPGQDINQACKLPAVETVDWTRRNDTRADLVVNTTPIGISAAGPAQSPLDVFQGKALAYDVVYADTPFLQAARKSGWETINGREMFIRQASEQFNLWTGHALPEESVVALDKFLNLTKNSSPD